MNIQAFRVMPAPLAFSSKKPKVNVNHTFKNGEIMGFVGRSAFSAHKASNSNLINITFNTGEKDTRGETVYETYEIDPKTYPREVRLRRGDVTTILKNPRMQPKLADGLNSPKHQFLLLKSTRRVLNQILRVSTQNQYPSPTGKRPFSLKALKLKSTGPQYLAASSLPKTWFEGELPSGKRVKFEQITATTYSLAVPVRQTDEGTIWERTVVEVDPKTFKIKPAIIETDPSTQIQTRLLHSQASRFIVKHGETKAIPCLRSSQDVSTGKANSLRLMTKLLRLVKAQQKKDSEQVINNTVQQLNAASLAVQGKLAQFLIDFDTILTGFNNLAAQAQAPKVDRPWPPDFSLN